MTTVAVDVVHSVAVEEAGAALCRPHGTAVAAVVARSANARHLAQLTHHRNLAATCRGRRRVGLRGGCHAASVCQLKVATLNECPLLVRWLGRVAGRQFHQPVSSHGQAGAAWQRRQHTGAVQRELLVWLPAQSLTATRLLRGCGAAVVDDRVAAARHVQAQLLGRVVKEPRLRRAESPPLARCGRLGARGNACARRHSRRAPQQQQPERGSHCVARRGSARTRYPVRSRSVVGRSSVAGLEHGLISCV